MESQHALVEALRSDANAGSQKWLGLPVVALFNRHVLGRLKRPLLSIALGLQGSRNRMRPVGWHSPRPLMVSLSPES